MRALVLLFACLWAGPAFADDPLQCPPPIDDDPRTVSQRAGQHYQRAVELYGAGEYDHAIPEFRAAYCLAPSPDALHGIAKSYESLVDYEQAVVWFEAYLHLLPSSERDEAERTKTAQHVKHLRALPAKIRVATDPPGAAIVLEGTSGSAHTVANASPALVPAGTYAMKVELPGFEPIRETIVAQIGQPYSYVYRLSPRTGTLRVATNPAEARILLDDKIVGVGTYNARLPMGKHVVTIEAEGRPIERRELTIEPELTSTLHVQMQPPAAKNGKAELMIASTSFGVADGVAIGGAISTEGPTIAVGVVAGGVLGFVLPYFVLPHRVPVGETSLIIGAQVWGAVEGVAIASTVLDGNWADHGLALTLSGVSASVGLGIGAAWLGQKLHLSAGDAALVNSGAIWGTTGGTLVWLAFGQDDRLGGPMVLAGLNVGLLAGGLLGSQFEMSRGHVALIDLSGFAGMVTGTALASVVKLSDNKSTARFSLGGMAIGLIVGSLLTSSIDSEPALTPSANVVLDQHGGKVTVFGLSGVW